MPVAWVMAAVAASYSILASMRLDGFRSLLYLDPIACILLHRFSAYSSVLLHSTQCHGIAQSAISTWMVRERETAGYRRR